MTSVLITPFNKIELLFVNMLSINDDNLVGIFIKLFTNLKWYY